MALALLLSISGAGTAVAADDCDGALPSPPYVGPAILIEFQWAVSSDRSFEYLVTSSDDPIGDPYRGDHTARFGGCGSPIEPLLITRRVWSPADQEAGLGTYSSCDYRDGWAELHDLYDEPGRPMTYTLTVKSREVCGGYEDSGGLGEMKTRTQPASAKSSAVIKWFRPGEKTPHEATRITAVVDLFQLRELGQCPLG